MAVHGEIHPWSDIRLDKDHAGLSLKDPGRRHDSNVDG